MKIHNYQALTSTQSKRRLTAEFDTHVNFEVFNQVHKGRFIHAMPESHEPCRVGFRPYQIESGEILGVKD